jgi:hypothetical protein
MEPDIQEELYVDKYKLYSVERYAAAWKDLDSIELELILDPECACVTPDTDSKGIDDVILCHKRWFEKISESNLSISDIKFSFIGSTESGYFMESQIEISTGLFDLAVLHTKYSILAITVTGGTFLEFLKDN